MENATKALLIAASVLIAILLIAMGVRIFSSTTGTVDSAQSTMDATAITTFNSQFAGNLNKPITQSKCATLVQKMIASNATNKSHQVTFNGGNPQSATAVAGIYTAEYEDVYISNIK